MIALSGHSGAAPRLVTCVTSDAEHIAINMDVIRLSNDFDRMYRRLGLTERDNFPGVFPVANVDSRVFHKVIDWCRRHKDQPELVVEKDPLTRECKWFVFTKTEQRFFDVPVPELLELAMAALFLDIPGLYHSACQAIAARIKGKLAAEVRWILQQPADLSEAEVAGIFARNMFLDRWTKVVPSGLGEVSETLHIWPKVLVSVLAKLSRADLERLQLVNRHFCDVILSSDELSEEQGPLRALVKLHLGTSSDDHHKVYWLTGPEPEGRRRSMECPRHRFAQCLKFCAVEKLQFNTETATSDELLRSLLPFKETWKNAAVEVSPRSFSSPEMIEFAFTELLFCKGIDLKTTTPGAFVSSRFLRFPAVQQCNRLALGLLINGNFECVVRPKPLDVSDVIEWLEREPPTQWGDEPMQLHITSDQINDDVEGFIDAVKKTFLAAERAHPYTIRLYVRRRVHKSEPLLNETTKEQLRFRIIDKITFTGSPDSDYFEWTLLMERTLIFRSYGDHQFC